MFAALLTSVRRQVRAMSSMAIVRHTVTPLQLFRVQAGKNVILRDYASQMAKKSQSFDLRLNEKGLVLPLPVDQTNFTGNDLTFRFAGELIYVTGPNGASLRPGGYNMGEILLRYRGKFNLIQIPAGIVSTALCVKSWVDWFAGIAIPAGLILIHEHSDHYSLQTTEPCTLPGTRFVFSHGCV